MIALPGLLIAQGKLAVARQVLEGFLRCLDGGLVPNRFPDQAGPAEYNTVDATLWMFQAVRADLTAGGDRTFLKNIFYPAARGIIAAHVRGTHHGIHVDAEDGLLVAGGPGANLTWMDARVDGRPVTPRHGKPVEVNALWYNALRLMERWATDVGGPLEAAEYRGLADRVELSFSELFWNPARNCLYDVDSPRRPRWPGAPQSTVGAQSSVSPPRRDAPPFRPPHGGVGFCSRRWDSGRWHREKRATNRATAEVPQSATPPTTKVWSGPGCWDPSSMPTSSFTAAVRRRGPTVGHCCAASRRTSWKRRAWARSRNASRQRRRFARSVPRLRRGASLSCFVYGIRCSSSPSTRRRRPQSRGRASSPRWEWQASDDSNEVDHGAFRGICNRSSLARSVYGFSLRLRCAPGASELTRASDSARPHTASRPDGIGHGHTRPFSSSIHPGAPGPGRISIRRSPPSSMHSVESRAATLLRTSEPNSLGALQVSSSQRPCSVSG